MNSVLQVTWMYFAMLPVQRWLNGIGAALLAISAVAMTYVVTGHSVQALVAAVSLSFLASIFIAFAPAMAGGFVLSTLSTRALLHLRPHGRTRMLLGSILAVALVSAVITAPLLLNHIGRTIIGPARGIATLPPPHTMFVMVCFFVQVFWCLLAVFSARPWRFLAALAATSTLLIVFRKPLFGDSAGVAFLLITAVIGWLSFARWYLNILRMPQPSRLTATRTPARTTLVERLTSSRRESWTPVLAQRQYLLDAVSPLLPLVLGCVPALCLAIPWMVGESTSRLTRNEPLIWMAFPIGMAATFAYVLIRRARFLWLHAGHDRTALFHVTEKVGLRVAVLTMATCMTAFLTISLSNSPSHAPVIITFATEQIALAAFMLYAGMCATRGWDAGGALVTAGAATIIISHLKFIQPLDTMPLTHMAGALVTMLLLVGLLRRYAQHRWLTLDWRLVHVTRPPLRT